ncbi:hypothetical protein FRC02_012250 [Tulasnella sp. 418]|nr:hypothetical protein FRC02_012250 [Tulasnella sp. 418]
MSYVLCLACSSSIPGSSSASYQGGHITTCCNRIICETCIVHNPRLKQYDPCLSCLAGTSAVSSAGEYARRGLKVGKVSEDNVFMIGDEEEDDLDSSETPPAPPVAEQLDGSKLDPEPTANAPERVDNSSQDTSGEKRETPSNRYWIKSKDTLTGLALKYGVDARTLCRLNDLPPSTLNTTPHLLHTRTFLIFPPNPKRPLSPPPADEKERLERLEREKATKRLQFVTKEVDYGIARAYVSLADTDDLETLSHKKESGERPNLKGRAVDMYLEDEEWERSERMAGRGPQLQGFPFFNRSNTVCRDKQPNEKGWWVSLWQSR